MPETCENWLGLVNSCVYYACQIYEFYQVVPYSVKYKALGERWSPPRKSVLGKCSLFGTKDR